MSGGAVDPARRDNGQANHPSQVGQLEAGPRNHAAQALQVAKRSEQLSPDQASLLNDLIDTDIAAIEAELKALQPTIVEAKMRQQPKRAALPPQFPRTLIHHEPDNSHCQCGCAFTRIGEDASEKLDYTPGVFTVEHHIRGKWACEQCETLIQAPVPAHVIDKSIPTASLLAHVMVAKFADHLPLYRQDNLWPRRIAYRPFDLCAMGRQLRRATPAACRCAARIRADARLRVRRRDVGTNADA